MRHHARGSAADKAGLLGLKVSLNPAVDGAAAGAGFVFGHAGLRVHMLALGAAPGVCILRCRHGCSVEINEIHTPFYMTECATFPTTSNYCAWS